jgi:hypothetical protein
MVGVLAGSAEAVQEVKQVVGVLAGGVEADEEVRGGQKRRGQNRDFNPRHIFRSIYCSRG